MAWSKNNNGHRNMTPRAKTLSITSIEFADRTHKLLTEFGPIPIIGFASLWQSKYEEAIDFAARRYDGGLTQFLRDNSSDFDLFRNEQGILLVALTSRPVSLGSSNPTIISQGDSDPGSRVMAIAKERAIASTTRKLFNEACYLWQDGLPGLIEDLHRKDLYVQPSAYEAAMKRSRGARVVDDIRRALNAHPSGIKVTEVYRMINLEEALTTFNVTVSMVGLIDEVPEIFYRQRTTDPQNDLVFDGFSHTIPDLTGRDDKIFESGRHPDYIVSDVMSRGLYARTLLLIRETGQIEGLKINVWCKSLENNFYRKPQMDFKSDMADINTLTCFLALARYDLIELRSGTESQNDIRAHFPRRYTDLMDLRVKLTQLDVPEIVSQSPEIDEQSVLETTNEHT